MQKSPPFNIFTLQRHLTNNCQLKCKHCYVDFSKANSISLDDFYQAMDTYKKFLSYFGIKGRVYYTGGDPFLHPNFWDIVSYSKENGLDTSIFGNFHFINDENIQRLTENNIRFYQLSMEGLKDVHEDIRGQGTFDGVLQAIDRLEKGGIYTLVNMTLSKMNANQLIPLIEYLAYNTNLSRFDFVRIVPIGKAGKDMMLTDLELKDIFIAVLELEKRIKKDGKKMVIGKKDHLWKLLYYQSEKLKIDMEDKAHGCGMGYRHLTVVENGDIYLCRKLPIKIGNIITDDLIDIYKNNKLLSEVLSLNSIVGCNGCKLEYVCRGCPAVTYGLHKNLVNRDPQCWK